MSESHKKQLMNAMKGRGIQYFQITQENSSYRFGIEPFEDYYKESLPYLGLIDSEGRKLEYTIEKKEYHNSYKKATISIRLENEISKESLINIGEEIQSKMFSMADKIFMFYLLPNMIDGHGCWASTHFLDGKWEVTINDWMV